MIVVSDATPLNILVSISAIDVLPQLYGRVFIPPAVAGELNHANTPPAVRAWLLSSPPWLEIRAPAAIDSTVSADLGEREAICLATELKADLLLVDDKEARRAARKLNLQITGTLGVLELAAYRGIIQLNETITHLRQTNFYISEDLLEAALQRDASRQK
jgi:predicted nucleic acid-binding protein